MFKILTNDDLSAFVSISSEIHINTNENIDRIRNVLVHKQKQIDMYGEKFKDFRLVMFYQGFWDKFRNNAVLST